MWEFFKEQHRSQSVNMSDIKPFDPNIPQEEVDRLFRKLKDTRLPEIPVVPDAGDDYGKLQRSEVPVNQDVY